MKDRFLLVPLAIWGACGWKPAIALLRNGEFVGAKSGYPPLDDRTRVEAEQSVLGMAQRAAASLRADYPEHEFVVSSTYEAQEQAVPARELVP